MRNLLRALLVLLVAAAGCAAAYSAGLLRFNYPSPSDYPIQGIDVSHHQGEIDWVSVAASGTAFAFIKSTEGATLQDPRFARNAAGASAVGLPSAPYHFFTFCAPGAAQAANFHSTAGHFPRSLPPVVDVEFVGNCKGWTSMDAVRLELVDFLERVEAGFSERPILYVTHEAEERVLSGTFPNHRRWPRSIVGKPSPTVWNRWVFWQFSDNGRVRGIAGPVDLNAYCCSRDEFLAETVR